MSEPSPAELIRSAYAEWEASRGTRPAVFLDLMSEDFRMRSVINALETVPFARARDGRDEARAYFDDLDKYWELLDFPTTEVVGEGDTVVFIGRCKWRNRETGAVIDTPKVDVWRFKDGKAISMLEMFDSLAFARAEGLVLA